MVQSYKKWHLIYSSVLTCSGTQISLGHQATRTLGPIPHVLLCTILSFLIVRFLFCLKAISKDSGWPIFPTWNSELSRLMTCALLWLSPPRVQSRVSVSMRPWRPEPFPSPCQSRAHPFTCRCDQSSESPCSITFSSTSTICFQIHNKFSSNLNCPLSRQSSSLSGSSHLLQLVCKNKLYFVEYF